MKMLFVHDHTFNICNGQHYTTGSLNQHVVDRYRKWFGEVTFLASYRNVGADNPFVRLENRVSGVGFDLLPKKRAPIHGAAERRRISDAVAKADCLVVRMPSFMGILAIREARHLGKPYLIEMVACPWDAYWNHGIAGKAIAPWITTQTKKACANADWVLYVTSKFLQRRYPTDGQQVACSDVEIDHIEESQLDARLGRWANPSGNAIKLVSVGNVAAVYKGHEFVIRALPELNSRNRRYEYYLVGGGDQTRLSRITRECKVQDAVHFVGPLPHEEISSFLSAMDVYVQPSLQEGLPRAVIEAMSCGLPVIGSDVGGIPELVGSEFIFKHGDAKAVAGMLGSLSGEVLSAAARRNIEKSKDYLSTTLDKRRDDFYARFRQSVAQESNKHEAQVV